MVGRTGTNDSLKTIGSYFNRFPSSRGELNLFLLRSFYSVDSGQRGTKKKKKAGRRAGGPGFYKTKPPPNFATRDAICRLLESSLS